MRHLITLTTMVMLLTVTAAVYAGDVEHVEKYKFRFEGANGDVELELNSQTMGFGLNDLQPGDSRTTVTENGNQITISRLAEVYALNVGGEVFEIPARHGPAQMGQGRQISRQIAIADGIGDGLTILSKTPLDETRRVAIRDALSAAGIADRVDFISPGISEETIEENIEVGDDGSRRIIIKRVISD